MQDVRGDGSDQRAGLSGALLALAAFPVVAFVLQVLARRAGELGGFSLHMGILLGAASAVAGALVLLANGPKRRFECAVALLAITATTMLAALVFRGIPDPGFDSQSYHLPSMLRLIAGWRPQIETTDLTLSNHYPSAVWTLLAGFAQLFGFESGRAICLPLMLSAEALLWAVMRGAGIRVVPTAVVTLVLSANPVALSQTFTAYADGLVWYLTVILLASLILMLDDRRWIVTLTAAAALILLFNTKLAGLFFCLLTVSVVGLLALLRGRGAPWNFLTERRIQITAIAMALGVAAGFVGWRPFMTNLLEHQRLIYPPPDELGFKEGVGNQVPPDLQGSSQAEKLASLFFARTDVSGSHIEWKIPGTFVSKELNVDSVTRVGGFGPLFGAAMIFGAATLLGAGAAAFRRRALPDRRALEVPAALLLLALLTTILFPEPWWARFVPAAWAIPSAAAVLGLTLVRGSRTAERWCGVGLAATLAVCAANSVFAGVAAVRESLFWTRDIEVKLDRLVHNPGPLYLSEGTLWNAAIKGQHAAEDVWRRRLVDHGRTDVVIVPRARCRSATSLSVDVMQCAPPDEPR